MIHHKRITVEGTASILTLDTILTGSAEQKRHVESVLFQEVTSTLQTDAILQVWLEQQQIAEISMEHFYDDAATQLKLVPIIIPLDLDLAEGQELSVGFTSGATASDFEIVARYTTD